MGDARLQTGSAAARLAAVAGVLALALPQVLARAQSGPGAPHPGFVAVTATTLSELRQWDARVDRMVREGTLESRQVRQDTVIAGRVHERYTQLHQGVPVFGGDLVRQTRGGVTTSIFATLYEGIDLDPTPALSVDAAKATVEARSGQALGPLRLPVLTVLPTDDGGYRLTYQARVMTTGDLVMYFIDADTGEVVLQYSDLKRQAAVGTGQGVLGDQKKISTEPFGGQFVASDALRPPAIFTYDLRGNLTRTRQFFNGFISLTTNDLAADADNTWTDGANVDAHVYSGLTYDYLFKQFGRRGLDDRDIPIRAIVHMVNRADVFSAPDDVVGLFYLNAFYAGNGITAYGEGLPSNATFRGTNVNFFAAALDIVAHELTHGVTDFSSNLLNFNEPGALNEAFSDMMGTGAEFFFQPVGGGPRQADYLLGEDIVSRLTSGLNRSLQDPRVFGDPDHYSLRFLGPEDNGGVHTNSTIGSHAFYLAIEGGTNRTSGLPVRGVGGANRAQIERVFYAGFTSLPSNATYSVARAAVIQAAVALHGAGSDVHRAVTEAWNAVGVF